MSIRKQFETEYETLTFEVSGYGLDIEIKSSKGKRSKEVYISIEDIECLEELKIEINKVIKRQTEKNNL